MKRKLSWSDHDRTWGPFLYSHGMENNGFALMATSVDENERASHIRLSLGRRTFMVRTPDWLVPPKKKKIQAVGWDKQTIERLGRDWFWSIIRRQYGISYSDGFLMLRFGRQTWDSSTDQSKGWFLPWTQWRFMETRHYDLEGNLLKAFRAWRFLPLETRSEVFLREYDWVEENVPKMHFEFKDFDGEKIYASLRIEEREWRFGEGWFKWLSLFRKPQIRRSADIRFDRETGRRKGSWKGGTIGTDIDLKPGEDLETAFKRYCAENEMTYIGRVGADTVAKAKNGGSY